jgi:hypothetical protein
MNETNPAAKLVAIAMIPPWVRRPVVFTVREILDAALV